MRQIIQSSWRPTGGAIRTTRLGAQPVDTSASACRYSFGCPADRRHIDQPGARTGCRMGDVHQPVDPGAAGRGGLDRGEVDHHIGVVGQLLQYRVAERPANKVDVGMQVLVRAACDAGDRVPGGDQLPGQGTPEQSGDASQQDPHA